MSGKWANQSNRHARGYGYKWTTARTQALARDGHLCQPCLALRRYTPAAQVDHIIPKAKGGSDDLSNLQSICIPCHKAKTAQDSGKPLRPAIGVDGWPIA